MDFKKISLRAEGIPIVKPKKYMSELIITTKSELQSLIQTLFRQEFERIETGAKPAPQTPDREFLSVTQASDFLNLKVPTIYGYVNKRKIPYIKPPGQKKLLFEKSQLITWLQNGAHSTSKPQTI